jgi:hypothetical protein
LHATCARLGQDLQRRRAVVGARILQFHARIFLLEGLLQWPDRLVHDQRRVPGYLAFFLGRLDQRAIGGTRRRCCDENGAQESVDSKPRPT